MDRVLGITDTTIGKKALVAITGVVMFGFLVGHLLGNLQIFLGPTVFNNYAATLHGLPAVLWGTRITLLVSVAVHIFLTVDLARRSSLARPQRYRMKRDLVTNYAAKTMILSGPIIAFYIVFHIAHLTLGAPVVNGYDFQPHDAYSNFIHGFSVPWIAMFYVIANALVAMHLYHGSTSFLQSLGLEHPKYNKLVRGAALGLALFVGIGNVSLPIAVLSGIVK